MAIKRKHIFTATAVLCIIVAAVVAKSVSTPVSEKYFVVEKGPFEAILNCKGEIKGMKSIEILTPPDLDYRNTRVSTLKVIDLVQDGKYVKKGDFIMRLDASPLNSRMREVMQQLETEQADLNNAKIDSTVSLTELREGIKNAKIDLEYNKIDLEQSIYESAAYQRKAQMTYLKAENAISKKQRDYRQEQNKLEVRVSRLENSVKKSQQLIETYQKAISATRITAPEDGIIIFGNSYDGTKYAQDVSVLVYSELSPPIATLPDMSEVISETFVKEIDISKIKVGDPVRVSFDALENVVIYGKISSIARIGEDHKDFDMKVFKVIVHLDESNEGLKPAMSSNNDIILANKTEALFAPLSAVIKDKGEYFVYLSTKDGMQKTAIVTGVENEEFVLVESGLEEGDKVILNPQLEAL
ncbi:MAG TPA: efflux RND transporter periplasmic adaptor subunit [Draconibacterium sp.]|nr:efflux RND transporter periplasmic adaptor subunit [Draconibacterium sp.]